MQPPNTRRITALVFCFLKFGEHNACAIFTLRLPRSCGVEKLLTLVGRREGIVSVEEL